MRFLIAAVRAFLFLVLLAPAPLLAADYADRSRLDALFALLRTAPDPAAAERATREIWRLWLNPTETALAIQMGSALAAENRRDYATSLAILDRVVVEYPDYAEGWNRRATIYYILNDFAASLADVGEVLKLEPRHFGALSGRVMIELRQGKRAEALKDMVAALAIHPYLDMKALFPELQQNLTNI
jgi:tetratricopeptide (TPR) repeat protein